jgi:4-amino-4-deoxy-L-arabinose transferase-like glycosyltransferase
VVPSSARAWPWLLLITLVAILIRLPYWEVIPASFDEVEQTSYAYLIAQGQILPLVGNDAYAGPFYFYLVAGLLRLGVTNPMVGRVVVLAAGVLTVPATYGWVRVLGRSRLAGLIAALFVALNPYLIVVNSHLGGTTMLMPLLTVLFLLALTLAVRRDSRGGLVAAGVVGGLAIQSNLVAALAVAGGLLWFAWESRRLARLGGRWPLWSLVAGLVVVAVLSPVILYNLTADFGSATALQGKSYLWEDNPTVATALNNARRLSLQLARQTGGVLAGDEDFATLVGFPLVYLALMLAGLVYTTRRVSTQPLFVIAPFPLLMPIFSSHYGFGSIARFTAPLIPVWGAAIACLLAAGVGRLPRPGDRRRGPALVAASALALLLVIYPVASLFRYYQDVNAAHETGRALLDLSRYAVAQNQGEPVYISTIEALASLRGVPYVPHAAFLLGGIHHEFLSAPEIIGRLFENPGPAFFLLGDDDAGLIASTIPLERVAIPANDEAALSGYGLYRLPPGVALPKPDFVLGEDDVPDGLSPTVTLGGGVELLGCAAPEFAPAGDALSLDCYWRASGEMPPDRYVGFLHLIDPTTGGPAAQDDHALGRESYPLNAWQPSESIHERFTLAIPPGLPPGDYPLRLGIYTWPSLTRLTVPGSADNVVALPPARIGRPE